MGRNHVHLAPGFPHKKEVISGMRTSCEVVIELNVVKAMHGAHKFNFFTSSNGVVLCEGLEDGSIPKDYFRSVIDYPKNKYIYSAPIDYLCIYDFECTCDNQKGTMKS